MAVLAQDLFNKLLAIIDNFTEDGVAIPDAENIDVQKKFIVFADMAQKELWKYNKVTKQVEITSKPPENRLGRTSNFNIVDFEGDAQYYPNEDGVTDVQGYSIKVDGDCTITFEEEIASVWTQIEQLTPTSISTLTLYKGVLTVTSTDNPVRMVISGTTHFRHKDRALWKVLYQADKVPEYAAWVKYDMPSDFNAIDEVVEEFPTRQYKESPNFKMENYRDYYYNFYFEGLIRITYKPIPIAITALTDTMQIDDVLAQAIVYDVGAKVGFYENKDVVNYCEQRRIEAKIEASSEQPASEEAIGNVYSGVGWN